MIPAMHERVSDFFYDAGLTDGYIVQLLRWKDSGKKKDRFMIFSPAGGSAIRTDLGADYYVAVDVVGRVGEDKETDDKAHEIIDYIQKNPMPNDCIGYIQNMGGMPAPITTTEDRIVYRLRFSVTFGE